MEAGVRVILRSSSNVEIHFAQKKRNNSSVKLNTLLEIYFIFSFQFCQYPFIRDAFYNLAGLIAKAEVCFDFFVSLWYVFLHRNCICIGCAQSLWLALLNCTFVSPTSERKCRKKEISKINRNCLLKYECNSTSYCKSWMTNAGAKKWNKKSRRREAQIEHEILEM